MWTGQLLAPLEQPLLSPPVWKSIHSLVTLRALLQAPVPAPTRNTRQPAAADRLCAQALNQATPVVKDAADTVAPYVKAGLQTASDVAGPALKAAEPVLQARMSVLCSFSLCRFRGTSAVGKYPPPLAPCKAQALSMQKCQAKPSFWRAKHCALSQGYAAWEWPEGIVSRLCTLSLNLHASPQGSVGEVERFLEAQGLSARALLSGVKALFQGCAP